MSPVIDGVTDSSVIAQKFADLFKNKKAQLSLTNPRDACEKFARFT